MYYADIIYFENSTVILIPYNKVSIPVNGKFHRSYLRICSRYAISGIRKITIAGYSSYRAGCIYFPHFCCICIRNINITYIVHSKAINKIERGISGRPAITCASRTESAIACYRSYYACCIYFANSEIYLVSNKYVPKLVYTYILHTT